MPNEASHKTGAVGIEFAADIKLHFPSQHVILVHSRSQLLHSEPLPDSFKEKSLEILKGAGVEVVLGRRVMDSGPADEDGDLGVRQDPKFKVKLDNGCEIQCGKVIFTTAKHRPNTEFMPAGVLDERGFVDVLPT